MRPRVLTVDDEASLREFVGRVLSEGGYEVAHAPNGAQALRMLDQHPPFDGYVIDVMMPGLRGDELARAIRRRDPDAKVLYCTGFSDALFTEKKTLWAGEAYLDKPVTVDGLLEALSLLLYGHTRGPGR
jgi:CheY-like chemotaxis protein